MRTSALAVIAAAGLITSVSQADVLVAGSEFGFKITATDDHHNSYTTASGKVGADGGRFDSTNDWFFGDVKFSVLQEAGDNHHSLKIIAKSRDGHFLKRDPWHKDFKSLEFNLGGVDDHGIALEDGFHLSEGMVSIFSDYHELAWASESIDDGGVIRTLIESTGYKSLTDFYIDKVVWSFKFEKKDGSTLVPLPTASALAMLGLAGVAGRRRR